MERAHVEREIRRLSPWYYRFVLGGVPTDITPPCDRHGHRAPPRLPDAAALELAGRRVLDAACNEGGYTFSALDRGAAHVDAFDVRAVNVEKARFVARLRGDENVAFHVASCDEWVRSCRETWDVLLCCGLLYHLTEPWRTVGELARLATHGAFVTCVLAGGEDGYTPFPEQENIAASEDPGETSMMPNTSATIVAEFVKHGLHPVLISESRGEGFWGGCSLYFRRVPAGLALRDEETTGGDHLDVHLAPGRDGGVCAMVYNRAPEPRRLEGTVVGRDARGDVVLRMGPGPLELDARAEPGTPSSTSLTFELPLPPGAPLPSEFELSLAEEGAVVATKRVRLGPAS